MIEFEKKLPEPNHSWFLSGEKGNFGVVIAQYIPKTLFNRFKWFISTKLFLPGTYEWKEGLE